MIDYSDVNTVIEKCFDAMQLASTEKYDSIEAEKVAALFLVAQMKVSFLMEDIEMKAKGAKNEVVRIEGQKYFEFKNSNLDKKITESMLANHIAMHDDIVKIKTECAQHESTLKKWNYLLGTLKDGHIYFRNIGKTKTWAE